MAAPARAAITSNCSVLTVKIIFIFIVWKSEFVLFPKKIHHSTRCACLMVYFFCRLVHLYQPTCIIHLPGPTVPSGPSNIIGPSVPLLYARTNRYASLRSSEVSIPYASANVASLSTPFLMPQALYQYTYESVFSMRGSQSPAGPGAHGLTAITLTAHSRLTRLFASVRGVD